MISDARGRTRTGGGASTGIDSGARASGGAAAGDGGGAGRLASVDQMSAAASNLLADVCTELLRAPLGSTISVSPVGANYPTVNMTGGRLFRQSHAELRTGNAVPVALGEAAYPF
jgi:hypothetical protein